MLDWIFSSLDLVEEVERLGGKETVELIESRPDL
jgi:hypothetical protein